VVVLLGLLTVLVFPLLATSVARGGRDLARVTTLLLAALFLSALALASPRFGNRLAATEGYWPIAGGILVGIGLLIGMPMVLSATAIHLARGAGASRRVVVGAGIGVALVGWIVGTVGWIAVAWR
jgi:hypothetical protein